jgi:hypothetical protein
MVCSTSFQDSSFIPSYPHLPVCGCNTSHPFKFPPSSSSSSNNGLPFLLPPSHPARGGNGGLAIDSSSSSSKLLPLLLLLVATGFLSAIERRGKGSSRYCCMLCELFLESSAGFLVGMGGGAGLRRTWGPPVPLCCWGEVKWPGRVGRERVDALDADRLRSFSASRLPSKPGGCVACVGKAGTMSFLAGG